MRTNPELNASLMTSEQLIEQAGLNWKVKQAPIEYSLSGGAIKRVESKLVNYREDTGNALGIVGKGYQVVQNSTAFAFLDSFLGAGIESYLRAGSWDDGARVYIRAKLPGSLVFANNDDDRGEKYVDFSTSHDGTSPLKASIVAWRLVCSNGLMGFRAIAGTKMKHTMNLALDDMRESLGILNSQFSIMEELSQKLSATPFQRDYFGGVLEKIGMIPKEEKRSTRAQNILQYIETLFDGGKGAHLDGARGTAWGAYNAITEYVDHYRGKDADRRAESAAIGSGARLKETALEVLAA